MIAIRDKIGTVHCMTAHVEYAMSAGRHGTPVQLRLRGERQWRQGIVVAPREREFIFAGRPGRNTYYQAQGNPIAYDSVAELRFGDRHITFS